MTTPTPDAPMTAERLAEIRTSYPIRPGTRRWTTDDAVQAFGDVEDLLAEVDRLRAALAEQKQISSVLDDYLWAEQWS